MTAAPDLSVVIPVFNEEDSILPLAQQLHDVLVGMDRTFEVIFVDDGSTDSTPVRLEQILTLDSRVRVVQLVQNAGQTASLAAGIWHARGKYVIALDADLQNDPKDIPKIVELLDHGHDVVSGWRRDRKDRLWTRRVPSIAANWILSAVSGVKLHDFGCTLKGYRAEFIRRVPMYSDMHRFLPAFAASVGAKVAEVVVQHHPRRFGSSKYGMGRIYRVMTDILLLHLLVHFAFRPLHWFGRISILVFLLSAGILLASTIGAEGTATIVYPSITVLGIYLGTTLLSLGFLCELVNRVGDTMPEPLCTVLDPEAST